MKDEQTWNKFLSARFHASRCSFKDTLLYWRICKSECKHLEQIFVSQGNQYERTGRRVPIMLFEGVKSECKHFEEIVV